MLVVAKNNITTDKRGSREWKRENAARKYTPPQARTTSGGWTQEGLDRYHELLDREQKERTQLAIKFEGRKDKRPDYLFYPRKEEATRKRKKTEVEQPRAEDVAVGIDASEMEMLGGVGLDDIDAVGV